MRTRPKREPNQENHKNNNRANDPAIMRSGLFLTYFLESLIVI
ncbi:hypothetical protein [Armatimonas sp.]